MTKTEQINNSDLKADLQPVLKHLLDLLREILGSIHEERILIGREEIHLIQDVLDRRQNLIQIFDCYLKDFMFFLDAASEGLTNTFSFYEGLEWFQGNLEAEDVELHLVSEQLIRICQEMQTETKTLVSFLEHKSALGLSLSPNLIKIKPKSLKIAIGLADENEELEVDSKV